MLGRRVPALALTIRRPPLAVRRACLRRRAFYASPCQATAPSLERFTHRAHSAGPLRPEVELTPSKVRKSNPFSLIFDASSRRFWGRKWRPKGGQHRAKIVPGRLPRRSWSRVAGRCGFLVLWGAFWADRAGGSKIDPNLVRNLGQMASGGVQVASKVVSKKGAISVLIFGPGFKIISRPPGGGPEGFN